MRLLPRALLALSIVVAAVALPGSRPARAAAPDLSMYQGLGAWIDLYDPSLLAAPEATLARLAGHGVRTLFIETSNYQMPKAVMNRPAMSRYLDAAHARGLRVVAWYVPGFTDIRADLQRSLAAVHFRSVGGQGFDSFGLDIESTRVAEWWVRSRRAVDLSKRLRDSVGPSYPLGAIVLPPPLLDYNPNFWPGYPFKDLGRLYDVFLPMGYWTFHYHGGPAAYGFTRASIDGIRTRTGRPSVPVHPIGGIADAIGADDARGFVHAVRDYGAIGASLYDVATSDDADWSVLADVGPIPVQDPPSPLALGKRFDAYGNLPNGDVSHPRDVAFRVGRHRGVWEVDYELFGVDQATVSVRVNWGPPVALASGTAGWTERRTLTIPAGALDHERNTIVFSTGGPNGPWPAWGVRRVSMVPGPLAASDRGIHGNMPGIETSRADRVTYLLPAGGVTAITVRAFDISAGEVQIEIGGRAVGVLAPTTAGAWGLPQTFVLPTGLPGDGPQRLTFNAVNDPPDPSVWGVRLVDASGLSVLPGI